MCVGTSFPRALDILDPILRDLAVLRVLQRDVIEYTRELTSRKLVNFVMRAFGRFLCWIVVGQFSPSVLKWSDRRLASCFVYSFAFVLRVSEYIYIFLKV